MMEYTTHRGSLKLSDSDSSSYSAVFFELTSSVQRLPYEFAKVFTSDVAPIDWAQGIYRVQVHWAVPCGFFG